MTETWLDLLDFVKVVDFETILVLSFRGIVVELDHNIAPKHKSISFFGPYSIDETKHLHTSTFSFSFAGSIPANDTELVQQFSQ